MNIKNGDMVLPRIFHGLFFLFLFFGLCVYNYTFRKIRQYRLGLLWDWCDPDVGYDEGCLLVNAQVCRILRRPLCRDSPPVPLAL